MEDSIIGREVDGYRIEEEIGRGGVGIVYRAEDIGLARPVAIKRLAPAVARNKTFFLRRFRSEARMLARLDSPYIVGVHALRQTELGLLIVMEYVEGGTLADKLAEGPLEISKAVTLFKRMLWAFRDAHGAGVLHRDIKPQNILLTPDEIVKVTDFGLARLQQRGTQATFTPEGAGTLNYMSPEQVQGEGDLDARSDIYALGMTFYEMLTGQLPFDEDRSQFARMQAIVEEEPPRPDVLRPEVPAGLSKITMKALQKAPQDRFQSVEVMHEAIEAYENQPVPVVPEESSTAEAPGRNGGLGGWRRRIGVALGSLLLFVIVGGYWFVTGEEAIGSEALVSWSRVFSSEVSPGEAPSQVETTQAETSPNREPQASRGRLSIATTPPGATVFLNGDRVGKTPIQDYAVKQGSLEVGLRKSGYVSRDTTIAMETAQPYRVDWTLVGGSKPQRDSASEEDGERLGSNPTLAAEEGKQTPPESTSSDAQPTISSNEDLEAGGATGSEPNEERQTTAREGKPSSVESPAREPATLILHVEPSGTIQVGEKQRKNTGTFEVRPGRQAIRFHHPEYGTEQAHVQLEPGQSQELTYYFEHLVHVDTKGPAGEVLVDREPIGETTPVTFRLGAGQHLVSVRVDGRTTTGGTHRVEPSDYKGAAGFQGALKRVSVNPSFYKTKHTLIFQTEKR